MIDLRQYQVDGKDFLVRQRRAILADEMGLGKTLQALIATTELEPIPRATLIVCPKKAVYVWQKEIKKWFPDFFEEVITVLGHFSDRSRSWGRIKEMQAQGKSPIAIITTYDVVRLDVGSSTSKMPLYYDHAIHDEAHNYRNRKTKTFKALKAIKSRTFFPATGTPASRGPQDLWTMLHLVNPVKYSSYWKFINKYCIVDKGPFGVELLGTQNGDQLRAELKSVMIRRTKRTVLPELPAKQRQMWPLDMTVEQAKVYKQLTEDMVAVTDSGEIIVASTLLAKIIRLRQLLITPKLLDPNMGYGAGLEMIVDLSQEIPKGHFVIFTPFAKAIPYIQEFLRLKTNYGPITTFQGGLSPKDLGEREEYFKGEGGVAIVSIHYATSFSLETASIACFLGWDYDPDTNLQAEARLDRPLVDETGVNSYYLQHRGTYEVEILEILNTKRQNVAPIFKRPDLMRKLLTTEVS